MTAILQVMPRQVVIMVFSNATSLRYSLSSMVDIFGIQRHFWFFFISVWTWYKNTIFNYSRESDTIERGITCIVCGILVNRYSMWKSFQHFSIYKPYWIPYWFLYFIFQSIIHTLYLHCIYLYRGVRYVFILIVIIAKCSWERLQMARKLQTNGSFY